MFFIKKNQQLEITKDDEVFKSKIFAKAWFDSEKIAINDISINELLVIQHNQLLLRVEG